jgi:hypothetical protein
MKRRSMPRVFLVFAMLLVPNMYSSQSTFAQPLNQEQTQHPLDSTADETPVSCLCAALRPTEGAGMSRARTYRLWLEKALSSNGDERLLPLNFDAPPATGQGGDMQH